jgi:hypothetical protein
MIARNDIEQKIQNRSILINCKKFEATPLSSLLYYFDKREIWNGLNASDIDTISCRIEINFKQ